MQSIEAIKNQLQTVKELEELTTALEQIAAAEMLHIRERILRSRPFIEETWRIYGLLHSLVPLAPEVKDKDLVLLITLNRGMAGTLVNKVVRVGERLYEEKKGDLLITGKKGHNHFMGRDERTVHFFAINNDVRYDEMEPLKKIVGQYARIHIVFPRYYSSSRQDVEIVSLTSSSKDDPALTAKEKLTVSPSQLRIEPDLQTVVNYFNQAVVSVMVYSCFSEALLAYNAAQMLAMHNAHDNAEEERKKMTAHYHKFRRELIDVKLRELQKSRLRKKQ